MVIFTLFALMVFVKLEAFERGTAGNYFMGEFALMVRVWVVIASSLIVDLIVIVLSVVWIQSESEPVTKWSDTSAWLTPAEHDC